MSSLQEKIDKKAEQAGIPLSVHFDLTYRCNLQCIHCYLHKKDRYPSQDYKMDLERQGRSELNTQEVFDVLDQLAECGTLFLTFSGGEIFMRSDIMEIIEYARAKRFSLSLMTTGTKGFNESVVDKLFEMGIQAVDMSLYSVDPETHESITGVPGSFRKTMRTIELLREKDMNVRIKCLVMTVNVDNLQSVVELADKYDLGIGFDSIVSSIGGIVDPRHLIINDEQLREYYKFFDSIYNNAKVVDETIDPACEDHSEDNPCGASHHTCYVSPYGDIRPCVEVPISCGNVRKQSVKDIWDNSEQMLEFRAIKLKDLRKCGDCPNPDYCRRCVGQAYAEYGNFFDPPTEFCRNVKIHHEVLQRGKIE